MSVVGRELLQYNTLRIRIATETRWTWVMSGTIGNRRESHVNIRISVDNLWVVCDACSYFTWANLGAK